MDGAEPTRPEPVGRAAGAHAEHQAAVRHLAAGTLACPACDAPVALGERVLAPAAPLACPFCSHAGPLRTFLSLAAPVRPARVEVRLRMPAPAGARDIRR